MAPSTHVPPPHDILPEDEPGAIACATRLAEAEAAFALACPPELAAHLRDRLPAVGDANMVVESSGYGRMALEDLQQRLDAIAPRTSPARPRTPRAAEDFLDNVLAACADYNNAAAYGRLAVHNRDAIDSLVREIEHAENLLEDYLRTGGVRDSIEATAEVGAAADRLRTEIDCETIGEAAEKTSAMLAEAKSLSELAERVIAALAPLLPDPGAIAASRAAGLSEAWHIVHQAPREASALIPVVAAIDAEAATAAVERFAKVARASAALDARFGPAWRSEPIDRLLAARQIVLAPTDARHRGALTYARSKGIAADLPEDKAAEALHAMAKTISAAAGLDADEALAPLRASGTPGVPTPEVWSAARALHDLVVSHLPEAVTPDHVAVMPSTTPPASLAADVAELVKRCPETATTIAGLVAEAGRRAETVSSLVERIGSHPGFDAQPLAELRRLGRVARNLLDTDRRIENNDVYKSVGEGGRHVVASALAWHEKARALLPSGLAPHNEAQTERLVRAASEGIDTLKEWKTASADLISVLGASWLPDAGERFSVFDARLQRAAEASTAIEARRHLAGVADEAKQAGLADVVADLSGRGVPPEAWPDLLATAYAMRTELREAERAAAEAAAAPDDSHRDPSSWHDIKIAPQAGSASLDPEVGLTTARVEEREREEAP